ncbi:MAG: hypothetical protein K9I74_01245 [Bacteroidales bacterium]|nr:hypothetical protein [Bacteroidales bacterium]
MGIICKAEALLDAGVELYCLGQIVHSEEELKRLEQREIGVFFFS